VLLREEGARGKRKKVNLRELPGHLLDKGPSTRKGRVVRKRGEKRKKGYATTSPVSLTEYKGSSFGGGGYFAQV